MLRIAVLLGLLLVVGACSAPAESPGARAPAIVTSDGADRTALGARAAHTMTALASGGLLVAGGCDVDGCASATGSTFVLTGKSVTRVADLAQARDAHTAVTLADGRVLVVGGFAEEGKPPLASAEVFDPRTQRWTTTGSLHLGRGGQAAALFGDGRVLVAGAWVGPSTFTHTTEIYDPPSGEFSAGPNLPVAADGLAAASLPDGCVLVVGGQTQAQVATDQSCHHLP